MTDITALNPSPMKRVSLWSMTAAMLLVIGMKSDRNKIIAVSIIWAVPVITNIICLGFLGFVY